VPKFEPYRASLEDRDRLPSAQDLIIRAALPTDVTGLAAIEAAREGGEVAEYASRLAKLIAHAATGEGLVLAAQHSRRLVGLAKVTHFAPTDDSATNVAPTGWYLSGMIVAQDYRRRGVGRRLTQARLSWIAERDCSAYYFANAQNGATIDLHRQFGFVELTRDFTFPGVHFDGGVGILFRAELDRALAR
jgi:ribosomal protein S18 acetylase RimI-like enzyme